MLPERSNTKTENARCRLPPSRCASSFEVAPTGLSSLSTRITCCCCSMRSITNLYEQSRALDVSAYTLQVERCALGTAFPSLRPVGAPAVQAVLDLRLLPAL